MKLLGTFLLFAFSASLLAREFRDLTNADGATIHAEILELEGETLRIRTNGKIFDVKVASLSEADQAWIAGWDAKQSGADEEPYYSEVVFEDDFSGDGFGERWGHYKSESLVQDGVMIGKTIDIKDHAGCDSVRFEGRRDMEVSVKFRFASEEAEKFNVWFDDKDYKGSHAGHILSVFIHPGGGSITDAKTGHMSNELYEMRKTTGGFDDAAKELIESTKISFEKEISRDEWHELIVRTKGQAATVLVDGEEVGTLESPGNAHETKSLVSLTTNINDVHYDDFVVKAAPATANSEGE